MTPEDIAEQRTKEAIANGQTWLDLGDLELSTLPDALTNFTGLKELYLGFHQRKSNGSVEFSGERTLLIKPLTDLKSLSTLGELEVLNVSGCAQLETLKPISEIINLRDLNVDSCEQLKTLEPISELTDLQYLYARGCGLLDTLEPLRGIHGLQHLDVSMCYRLETLEPISALINLEGLDVNWCWGLKTLEALKEFINLLHLNVSYCRQLETLEPIRGLTNLRHLNVSNCLQLEVLEPITGLANLRHLDVSNCKLLETLESISDLTKLQHLNVSNCVWLKTLKSISLLTRIQHLNVSDCNQLETLKSIRAFTNMRHLNLSGCSQLETLEPISKFINLLHLSVSFCNQLETLEPISEFTNLQHLDVSGCKQLEMSRWVTGLTKLRHLDVISCDQLETLEPISGLTRLKHLDASVCVQLKTLKGISGLVNLRHLDVNGCEKLKTLEPISRLTNLRYLCVSECKRLETLEPISGLTDLRHLDVSWCDQLKTLEPISEFIELRHLGINGCKKLETLEPTSGLTKLQHLHVYGTNHNLSFELLDKWLGLATLNCSEFKSAPREVLSSNYYTSCLESLHAWRADLGDNEGDDARFKLFLLGNGEVGKTQLRRYLRKEPLDESIKSTHGVEVEVFALPLDDDTEVEVCLWDFGGQDIYLSTHSLFLEGRSVVALLWNPEMETRGEYQQDGLAMRAHPLTYWSEYVKNLTGTDNPVVVIQSQCKKQKDRINPPPCDFSTFNFAPVIAFCREPDLGHAVLDATLQDAIRYLFETQGLYKIGESRRQIRADLETLRDENGIKSISYEDFDARCEESGGISSTEHYLDYLQRTGAVFYNKGLFGNEIVLDQGWALRAIYTIFDRDNAFRLFNNHGKFTLSLLAGLVWSKYETKEQELFLGMMMQCGICFPNHPRHSYRTEEEGEFETEYIAPDLLPATEPGQERCFSRRQQQEDSLVKLEFKYDFLHDGTFRQFMCNVGRQVGDAGTYWKNGFRIYERKHDCEAVIRRERDEALSGAGKIVIEVWGSEPRWLLNSLQEQLSKIQIGKEPEITGDVESMVDRTPKGDPLITNERVPNTPEKSNLGGGDFGEPSIDHVTGVKPEIFVSYAWGEDTDEREDLVNKMCAHLEKEGRDVIRDKTHIRSGELISDFMRRIGAGECVIVVLSDRYLHSAYCMNELYQIYQRCAGNKDEFLDRIIPLVLDDVKISKMEDRETFQKFWTAEYNKHNKIIERCGTAADQEDFKEVQLMKAFRENVMSMLRMVQDKVMPRGYANILEDDFRSIFELLPELANKDS